MEQPHNPASWGIELGGEAGWERAWREPRAALCTWSVSLELSRGCYDLNPKVWWFGEKKEASRDQPYIPKQSKHSSRGE